MNTQPAPSSTQPVANQVNTQTAATHQGFYGVLAQLVRQHKRQRSVR